MARNSSPRGDQVRVKQSSLKDLSQPVTLQYRQTGVTSYGSNRSTGKKSNRDLSRG